MPSGMSRLSLAKARRLGSLVALVLLQVSGAVGDEPPSETAESVAKRIVELRREESDLLDGLAPELRAEVDRLLAEMEAPETPPPPTPPAGEAADEAPAPEVAAPGALLPSAAAEPVRRDEIDAEADRAATTPAASPGCPGLALLDFDGDGALGSADHYWRFLRLWLDDGDARIGEGETSTLFEAGVRRVGLELRTWSDGADGGGDVRVADGRVIFEVPSAAGGPWSEAVFVVDAGGIGRGSDLRIVDAAGAVLGGLVAVTPELRVRALPEGEPLPLLCR